MAAPGEPPLVPDRQAARIVVGLDIGAAGSGYCYYIRPAPAAGGAAGAAEAGPEAVQPIQFPGRWAWLAT